MNNYPRPRGIDTNEQRAAPPPPLPVELPAVPAAAHQLALHSELAQTVRRLYVAAFRMHTGQENYGVNPIPQWDGGETARGVRRQSVWKKIAYFIVEHGLDPLQFIQAQFWGRPGSRPPPPDSLLTEGLQRYREYGKQIPGELVREHRTSLLSVEGKVSLILASEEFRRDGWDYVRALRYALQEITSVTATALFRHALASAESLPDIALQFREQALLQYVFQQTAYDEAWADLRPPIPPALQAAGRLLRQRFTG